MTDLSKYNESRLPVRLLYWFLPALVCTVVYWYALRCWFLQDDFVWLNLRNRIYDWNSFWHEVLIPTGHGTWRPLSERIFFIVFSSLFGLNAIPYRICTFLTFFADLALLSSIMRRITGSRAAGFWAAIFWVVNPCLMTAMTWSCAYMQFLCGFFLLLAFHFLLRYIETGKRRYYYIQVAVFLVGFTVMETNLVYPALAAAYTFLFARKHFKAVLPLFAISAAFFVAHTILVPKLATGIYSQHFDLSMLKTFRRYWGWALTTPQAPDVIHAPRGTSPTGIAVLSVALGGFLLWQSIRRRWMALFLFFWFLLLLAPVLPLRDHISYYYLTLPMLGLAALGGWAFASGWRARGVWRTLAVLLAGFYVLVAAPVARRTTKWEWMLTSRVKFMMDRVDAAQRANPKATILLAGVDNEFFWYAIFDRPFQLLHGGDVYLVPGTENRIQPREGVPPPSEYVLPVAPTREDFERRRVVVLQVNENMRDATAEWSERLVAGGGKVPTRVDLANQLQDWLLGAGWYQLEQGYRWMSKRASVKIGGPGNASAELHVTAHCVAEQLRQGPLELLVLVDGTRVGTAPIRNCDDAIEAAFPLPPSTAGKPSLTVTMEVSRTLRPPNDPRDLGLIFGALEVR